MTIAIFLVGEYNNNTELYMYNLLKKIAENEWVETFRCTFFEQIPIGDNSRFLIDPYPQNMIYTSNEKMHNWVFQQCFDVCLDSSKNRTFDTIIVLPYNIIFNNDSFEKAYQSNRLTKVCYVSSNIKNIIVPKTFCKISVKCHDINQTKLSNDLIFENVFTPTYRNEYSMLCSNVSSWKMYENCNFDKQLSKCICIPSIIHVKHPNRSVFSASERLDHTIRQIKSIRKYTKNTKIILLEMSTLSAKEIHQLSHITDIIWTFDKDPVLQRLACDDPNKNKAEIYVLREFWSRFKDISNITHFAKFGGRYWFTKNSNSLFTDKAVMKCIYSDCYERDIVEPVFYSVPRNEVSKMLNVFDEMMHMMNNSVTDNECQLYDLYVSKNDVHSPQNLYIQGYAATSGIFRYY